MKTIHNEKGFTLVELLVSMLIFAIGVAALTQTLIATMRGNNLGNKETTAMTLAYHELEELRGITPGGFDTDPRLLAGATLNGPTLNTGVVATANDNVVPNIFGGVTRVVPPGGYHISYTVADINTGNGSLFYIAAKQVTVTVTWRDPQIHSVTISSVLTPNI